jgi:hypothetical protein
MQVDAQQTVACNMLLLLLLLPASCCQPAAVICEQLLPLLLTLDGLAYFCLEDPGPEEQPSLPP